MDESNISETDEIDLIELAKLIWRKRVFSLKIIGITLVLGVVIAFTSNVEYKAFCKLLPEAQEGGLPNLGGLGNLAGLAGFDLSSISSSGGLSPDLYPEIISSAPFLSKLIETPIYFENRDTTISSFIYFDKLERPSLLGLIKEYTVGLPWKIKGLFATDNTSKKSDYGIRRFSKDDWKLIEAYSERLTIDVDDETGIISIEAEMPDPVAAASTVSLLVDDLMAEIINYKVAKAKVNLKFVQKLFGEAKAEYELKQKQLAIFTDQNRNVTNSIMQTEYERLQNEMNISFEVYKGIASQLEQAKIRVKEETPAFTILEPVRIPEEKSKPKRVLIIILFSFIGGISSVAYIIIKNITIDK